MRAEYAFDYRKARPNRFAARMQGVVRTVVLDPDVAAVFRTSKSVNDLLRSVIASVGPGRQDRLRHGRKAV